MGTHRRGLGREAEPGHDLGHQDEQRQVGQRQAGYGNAHQGHGVALGLLFLARAQTLADDGNHRQAHRRAGNVRQRRNGVRHCVGRNGRGAQSGRQAADAELADLEHTIFKPRGDTDGQHLHDRLAPGAQVGEVLDPQRVVHILVLPQDEHGGEHAANQCCQRRTDNAHAETVN